MSQRSPNEIYLSIVIPAYNESNRIEATLNQIILYFKNNNFTHEVIIVDDGSTDDTVAKLKNFQSRNGNIKIIRNKINRGKGYSVKKGILASAGNYILFSDADMSVPIEELNNLLPWFKKGYTVVIGSRALAQSNIVIHQKFYREMMGRIFNLFVRLFVLRGMKDTQCGFKCFDGHIVAEIFNRQTIKRFSFDVEILFISRKLGYKIKEVPIQWYNSIDSKVSLTKDAFKMLLDLFRIRLLHYNLSRSSAWKDRDRPADVNLLK